MLLLVNVRISVKFIFRLNTNKLCANIVQIKLFDNVFEIEYYKYFIQCNVTGRD